MQAVLPAAFPEARPRLVPRPDDPARCRKEAATLTAASGQRRVVAESGQSQQERTTVTFLSHRAGERSNKIMIPQYRADLPRGSWGRLRRPPEKQKVLARPGMAESQEDIQEEELWGLGDLGASRERPRVPDSSPPPTRSHCRYRRHLVPGLLRDPEPPFPPAHVEPRILAPALSGFRIGPATGGCPIGGARTLTACRGRDLGAEAGLSRARRCPTLLALHQTEELDCFSEIGKFYLEKKGGREKVTALFTLWSYKRNLHLSAAP